MGVFTVGFIMGVFTVGFGTQKNLENFRKFRTVNEIDHYDNGQEKNS